MTTPILALLIGRSLNSRLSRCLGKRVQQSVDINRSAYFLTSAIKRNQATRRAVDFFRAKHAKRGKLCKLQHRNHQSHKLTFVSDVYSKNNLIYSRYRFIVLLVATVREISRVKRVDWFRMLSRTYSALCVECESSLTWIEGEVAKVVLRKTARLLLNRFQLKHRKRLVQRSEQ